MILLTFLVDKENTLSADKLWDIYYHFYVDNATTQRIVERAQKLAPLLKSSSSWAASPYGKTIKFCDDATLHDAREICKRIIEEGTKPFDQRARNMSENIQLSKQILEQATGGTPSNIVTGMRSAAPLSLQSKDAIPTAYGQYWIDGRVMPRGKEEKEQFEDPNPMFSALVSRQERLHYGTDPILGFHLASAFAPIAAASPLKPVTEKDCPAVAVTAQLQFSQWVKAFRDALKRGLVVRLVVADVFSFCYTLLNAATTKETSANWFRRQWDHKTLDLSQAHYGPGRENRVVFDMIDTSNLADHVGGLNILAATAALLKNEYWATIHTELLINKGQSDKDALDLLLCGPSITMSMLLGVTPVQYWTAAKMESHSDEIFISMMQGEKAEKQLYSRLTWKRDEHFSVQPEGRGKLHAAPKQVVDILFQVYLRMFARESMSPSMITSTSRDQVYSAYQCTGLAALMKSMQPRLETDWNTVCKELVMAISKDRTLALSTNHCQELMGQFYMTGIVEDPFSAAEMPFPKFKKWWSDIPMVAVTLAIERKAIDRVFQGSIQSEMASPTVYGMITAAETDELQYLNAFTDVHLLFGEVNKVDEDTQLDVTVDAAGWAGSASLLASFYVPSSALDFATDSTVVQLSVLPGMQSIMAFGKNLGPEMSVYEAKFGDKAKVFVSKNIPGQASYPKLGEMASLKETIDNRNGSSTKLMVDTASTRFKTVTAHVDITSDNGKKLLKDKVPIELEQTGPFTIDIVFGQDAHRFPAKFPVPVTMEGSRTRVARNSAYIEVIAPIAQPLVTPTLSDFIFPTVLNTSGLPVTLNAPHISLDKLPILDVEKKEQMGFLTTSTSFQFSTRERRIREGNPSSSGLADDLRVNFKESIFTMYMLASGLQGGQTGLFAINNPEKGGNHMLIVVSAFRLDADTASTVLDAAVLPLTVKQIVSGVMNDFLMVLSQLQCASISVNDAELEMWKKALPALAERCRTWSHKAKCEYKKKGATVPVSLEDGQQVLCSCGQGKLPKDFIDLPEWDKAAPYATRIAISTVFPVPYVEEVVDTTTMPQMPSSSGAAGQERCRSCGKSEDQVDGALKRCRRCRMAKYCSVDCQRKDWRTHRAECEDFDL